MKTPPNFDHTNQFSRSRNSIVEGIDKAKRMPKYIILFFDLTVLKRVNCDTVATMMLQWLCNEIKRLIETWKDIWPKKP